MPVVFCIALLFSMLAPVCNAQTPPPAGTRTAVAPVLSDAEQRQAERAREDARRALDDMMGADTDTATLEAARDNFRRGDEMMAAHNFAVAAALYGQTMASARAGKTARDRGEQQAKQAEVQFRSTFTALASQVTVANSREEKAKALALEKFQQGEQALQSGQFGAARRLFLDAEGFLKRILRTAPGVTDDCAGAQANLDRVQGFLQRGEQRMLDDENEVVRGLLGKSRSLLDDARRLYNSNQCDESLRTSRLAENALKRAAEMVLQARR